MQGYERETTIISNEEDSLVRIWSAQKRFITKMRNNNRFTEVKSGYIGRTEWAEFTIEASEWNPASGAKRQRKEMTSEQRQNLVDRMNRAREQKV